MDLAGYIDHTILKTDATKEQIEKICDEAAEYHFASVCINPCYVEMAAQRLKETNVKVATVIGFPLGATTTACKTFETIEAIKNGADEVDMVANIGAIKEGNYELVQKDVQNVVEAAHNHALVKVIIETCLLTDDEKRKTCEACVRAGADFVKTSTGFSTGGATPHDVALMKEAVAGKALVKAAGGIRTKADAEAVIKAGADRIGTSHGVDLVK